MTYDDRDRDTRDETVPDEGDARDDMNVRRPTDLDDEVENADDLGQKMDGGIAVGAVGADAGAGTGGEVEDEPEGDDAARRDDQTTNR
jgi:hypothetical protein